MPMGSPETVCTSRASVRIASSTPSGRHCPRQTIRSRWVLIQCRRGGARAERLGPEVERPPKPSLGRASTMSLAIRFQGGTSTGANLSPNRCRNRSRRCSSPEKSGGRSAPPPSSTFFAGATAWFEWAIPCWRTDAIPHRWIRSMQAASSQSGTTASATGARLRSASASNAASWALSAPASSSRHQNRTCPGALSSADSSSCSAVTEALSYQPSHDVRGTRRPVERPAGGKGARSAAGAVNRLRQLRARKLAFRHSLRQPQLDQAAGALLLLVLLTGCERDQHHARLGGKALNDRIVARLRNRNFALAHQRG